MVLEDAETKRRIGTACSNDHWQKPREELAESKSRSLDGVSAVESSEAQEGGRWWVGI